MTSTELFDLVYGTPLLKVLKAEDKVFWVKDTGPANACLTVTQAFLNFTKEEALDVLFSIRPAHILDHMTRIVGYYGLIENFNRSKLGEVADRRKGDYGVEIPGGGETPVLSLQGSQGEAAGGGARGDVVRV